MRMTSGKVQTLDWTTGLEYWTDGFTHAVVGYWLKDHQGTYKPIIK